MRAGFLALPALVSLTIVLSSSLAAATPIDYPALMLHVAAPVAKNVCENGQVPCDQIVTAGTSNPDGSSSYYVYLLAKSGLPDTSGTLGGLQCGIAFDRHGATPGVRMWGWTNCATLQFAPPTPAWPDSGSGNLITWDAWNRCQTGETAVAGFFYLSAYGPSNVWLTPRPVDGIAKTANCGAVEFPVRPSLLGFVSFGGASHAGDTDGFNSCDEISPYPPPTIELSIAQPLNQEVVADDDVLVDWNGSIVEPEWQPYELRYDSRIDGGDWLTNGRRSQRTFTNLPIGNHQVDVVARAVDGTEASASVTFETLGPLNDPPATILLTGPPAVSPAPATVTFTWSGEDDRTAVGDLRYTFGITNDWDQAAPTAVTMATFSISQPGIYQFQVRAHDLDGEKDPTAASRHFRVEVVEPPPPPPPAPPETFIITGPRDGGSQYNPNVTYGFTGTDDSTAVAALLFSWRLDGAPWTPFVPETSADVVLQNWGLHFFEVRAMDGGGRIDPTPASRQIWLGDIPDPVALATMSAAIVADQVELNWTANLDEIIDFQVERAPASEGPFVAISPRIPASKSGEFRWRDVTAPPATTLHYRLAWVERAGQRWSNVVSINTPVATFRILALAPNPTPGGATLHFALSRESVVSVLVFDIAGRPVRTLPLSVLAAGAHLVAWDGRLDSGEAAPAGAYYVRLEAGGLVATRALMVVR